MFCYTKSKRSSEMTQLVTVADSWTPQGRRRWWFLKAEAPMHAHTYAHSYTNKCNLKMWRLLGGGAWQWTPLVWAEAGGSLLSSRSAQASEWDFCYKQTNKQTKPRRVWEMTPWLRANCTTSSSRGSYVLFYLHDHQHPHIYQQHTRKHMQPLRKKMECLTLFLFHKILLISHVNQYRKKKWKVQFRDCDLKLNSLNASGSHFKDL